jgi:hypothetical protein
MCRVYDTAGSVTRFLRDLESHQLQRLETRMPVAADDEVVVHRNAQWPRDLDDRPRHVDVGARGGGIAGGMVVQEQTMQTSPLIALEFLWSPEVTGGVHWGR